MPDQDWTKPKPVGEFYTNPYDKDSDRITVTRGYIMWVMHEAARLSAMVQTVELQNGELKAEVERLRKAGDWMCGLLRFDFVTKEWDAAKEGKPKS